MEEKLSPGLYIVATPIGNLGDLTARAADVLRRVDLVLAEDKRVSARLLSHAGSKVRMQAYHDHSSEEDRLAVLARLGGEAVALISDAGTPLISDPGFKLVRAARSSGFAVHTLPGPCAAIAALTLSGLATDRFLFVGFLPPKPGARGEALAEVAAIRATLVFYESGPRLGSSLAAMAEVLGPREAAVVREITKLHEETVTGTLAELARRYADSGPKGEIVMVVAPPAPPAPAGEEELNRVLTEALAELSPSRAAAQVAEQLRLPRKQVYARALALSELTSRPIA
ncbi:MAG TPA: 16S rRNA (cytidine(1402)-2'-O)-methyltransferase [Sphingomicrobium sp.]|nr:16S rRNA (cytidine(1402)-2'-O)-methyltransferase [Sphingomicrobium sp.]